MTTEERLERIEQPHSRNRRGTPHRPRGVQRHLAPHTGQIDAAGAKIGELAGQIIRVGEESREADRRLEARIEQLAEKSRAADKRLGARTDAPVSGFGEFIANNRK